MDPFVVAPLLAGAMGASVFLFFWASGQILRDTVDQAGVDKNAETISSKKAFRLLLPFIQVFSYYIAKIPAEYANEALGMADESLRTASFGRRLKRLMGRVRSRLRIKLLQAGKGDTFTADDMLATCIVSAFIWTGIGFYMFFMGVHEDKFIMAWTGLGVVFPLMSLSGVIKKRQKQLIKGLPYSIDLLSLSMEAGLDFTTALQRIVDRQRGNAIAQEFGEMLRQVKLGRTRREALKDLAARNQLEDITSFCNSLIQADELGTPIGPVLQTQAEMMRFKRFQRAEELAGKAPVKILFPLVAFIMPTVFMMLFGPIFLTAFGVGKN